jgi:cell division protein FtsB
MYCVCVNENSTSDRAGVSGQQRVNREARYTIATMARSDGEWGIVVSDDEGSLQQQNRNEGTLIMEGEEASDRDPVSDLSLHGSNDELSWRSFQRIASILVSNEDGDQGEKDDINVHLDDDEVQEAKDELDDVENESFLLTVKRMERKKIIVLVASVVMLILCLVGGKKMSDIYQRSQKLEQEEQRSQKLEQRVRELEEENKECREMILQEKARDEWVVADTCYLHIGLGECAQQTVEEWNDVAESARDAFGAAWKAATSWTHQENDNSEEPSMASVHEAFSEATRTVARTADATAKEVTKTANAATHSVAKIVATFWDGMEENLQLMIEATRDSVEDGTAYSRPPKKEATKDSVEDGTAYSRPP